MNHEKAHRVRAHWAVGHLDVAARSAGALLQRVAGKSFHKHSVHVDTLPARGDFLAVMSGIKPSEILWLFRRRNRLDRRDAAILLGVSPRALRSWEEDRRTPPIDLVRDVANRLNIRLSESRGRN